MSTIHYSLRDLLADQIKAPPAIVPAGNVMVSRRRPMPVGVPAQIFVDLDDSPAIPQTVGGAIEWNTKFRVEILARDVVGADKADVVADGLLEQTYTRLMSDTRLGGNAIDMWPSGVAWRVEDEADTTVSSCIAIFSIRHRTPKTSLATSV